MDYCLLQKMCYLVSGIRYPLSGTRYPVSAIRYPLSGIRYPVSGIRYPGFPPCHMDVCINRSELAIANEL